MGIIECCSSFLAGLPDPALPMLPSFLLGVSFSAIFLIFVYKKQSNLPISRIIVDIVSTILGVFPTIEHPTNGQCKNLTCVRCKKYKETESKIVQKFEDIKIERKMKVSRRIEDAVKLIENKTSKMTHEDIATKKTKDRRSSLQKPTLFYMDLAANPYWNEFDVYKMEIDLLKLNFSIILSEFHEVFGELKSGNNQGWKLNDIPRGHWCIFPFIDQGVVNQKNCNRCPNTSTMVGSLPSLMKDCIFGNACFSILYPDSSIEPHHGPTNLRLRCHLGLVVPNGCWLEVDGKQYRWKPQQAVIFDDSFEHSATFVNQLSSAHAIPRAVLMIDFWHPDVTADEKKVLQDILSP